MKALEIEAEWVDERRSIDCRYSLCVQWRWAFAPCKYFCAGAHALEWKYTDFVPREGKL
jgi:hypothetical protein